MKKILILNGPNLNLLGKREPGIYGARGFEDYYEELRARYAEKVELDYFQSNIEGELINKIMRWVSLGMESYSMQALIPTRVLPCRMPFAE